MGLDETLVKQLSDGSAESMAILDEFVNGTDTSVNDINAAWKRMNESRQTVSQAMAAIQTDVEKKLGEMVDDAKAAGIDTVKAMASKIEGNKSYVTRAMQELAEEAISAYNRTISNGKYKTPSGAAKNAKDVGISPVFRLHSCGTDGNSRADSAANVHDGGSIPENPRPGR